MAKGATIDVPMHWAYLMGTWRNVPLSHDKKFFLLIPKILMWQHVQLSSFGARSGSLDLKYQNFALKMLNILVFAPKDPKDLEFCPMDLKDLDEERIRI